MGGEVAQSKKIDEHADNWIERYVLVLGSFILYIFVSVLSYL